jgi:hypothetical protein
MQTVLTRLEYGSEREQTYWAKVVVQVRDVSRREKVEGGEGTGHDGVEDVGYAHSSGEKRVAPNRGINKGRVASHDLEQNLINNYRTGKPANNVFFGRDSAILCLISWPVTVWKARNSRTLVRIAEESNRLAERGHPVGVCFLRRGCDNTMESRTKNVITPSRKEITCVHDNSPGLKGTQS